MTTPLISVIVPVYRVEKYLERCVKSILSQTYKNLEVILVDDGSPDQCPAICDACAEKDARVKVIHQENKGLSGARNAGIDAASGEYLAFVDSDDYVSPHFIEELYQLLQDTGCAIGQCRFSYVKGDGLVEEGDSAFCIYRGESLMEQLYGPEEKATCFVVAWNKLYRAELFKETGIRYPEGRIHEDEATTALDVSVARQVLELLNDLKRERGLTLIFITHDLALLPGIADRVALMYAGEIVEMAPTEAFLAHPEHPYAQALLGALPRPDGAPLQPVEGSVPNLWGPLKGCAFAPRCARAKSKCFEHAPAPQSRRDGLGTVRCIFAGDKTTAECRTFAAPEAAAIDGEPVLELQHAAVRTAPKGFTQSLAAFVGRAVGRTILPDCTLRLHRAETLALVGESGSGKTTAALTALGLLGNGLLAEGTVRCGGISMPVAGPRSPVFRRKVQIVFQDPFSSLDPRMTVGQILEEALVSLRPDLTPAERLLRMQALLKETGLAPESLECLPHEFSGGQRQRIAIARALSVEPEVIVLDEPTSALDVSVQAQILNLLGSLQRERGLAYLLITHNFAVVEHAAHRVAVMQGGRIVEEGAAAAVLTHPKAAYTKRLLASVPRL